MDRAEKIEAFRTSPVRARKAWEAVPDGAKRFRPAPGEWSPHELVIHMADAEVNGYLRFRKLVAEPGATVGGYEQDDWATTLDYHSHDPELALDLMDTLNAVTYPILTSLSDEAWTHEINRTDRGPWGMDNWLKVYAHHVDTHITQMNETIAAWRESQG